MTEYTKPIPVPDEMTKGFWDAAKEHKLAFQRCQHCGNYSHPPVVMCRECSAPEPSFKFDPVSGRGKIVNWTVFYDPMVAGFAEEIPWVNVIVELDEQKRLRFLASLVDGPKAPIKIGARVEVVFKDISPEISLPYFKLT